MIYLILLTNTPTQTVSCARVADLVDDPIDNSRTSCLTLLRNSSLSNCGGPAVPSCAPLQSADQALPHNTSLMPSD